MKTPQQIFAKRLREVRGRMGFTQGDVVDGLRKLGFDKVDAGALSLTESAKVAKPRRVTLDEFFAICWVLKIPPTYMLALDDDTEIKLGNDLSFEGKAVWKWMVGQDTLPGLQKADLVRNTPAWMFEEDDERPPIFAAASPPRYLEHERIGEPQRIIEVPEPSEEPDFIPDEVEEEEHKETSQS